MIEQYRDFIASHNKVAIVGTGSHQHWLPATDAPVLQTLGHRGLVDYWPEDRVVTVRSGTTLNDLNLALAEHHQMIPVASLPSTIGGLVAMNLPHANEARYGPVKDWVLGMTILTSDGLLAKVGSRVAKNVAGYDIHRAMAGSRGEFGLILDIHLRTFPLAPLLPPWDVQSRPMWVSRTLSQTELRGEEPNVDGDGWWMGPHGTHFPHGASDLRERLRISLDPESKWASGWAK